MAAETKKFRGWGVLAAAFLMSFIPTALLNNCFALYMNPVCADLGFSTTGWSVVNLIASIASAAGAILAARWYQQGNMKWTMVLCAVGTGVSFALSVYARHLWQMYLIFAVGNLFLAGLTQLPISMLITAWFESRRSTMMSVAMAGSGLGGLIWSPVLTRFITAGAGGWRTAMVFSAVTVGVVMTLTALFLVRRSPEACGTEPYRVAGEAGEAAAPGWVGVSLTTAVGDPAWKAVIGTVLLVGALASGVTTHVPNYITDLARDGGAMQGTVLSVYSLVFIAGMVGGGVLMDRIGVKRTALAAVILAIAGLLCLILARWGLYFAYGYCIFFSLSMFLPRLLPAILLSEVFGVQDYAALYARMNLFFLIGAALGSVLTALLAKLLGYAGAWAVYIILTALFFLCVAAALKGGTRLRAQYPEGEGA
ncbi:MAG: MFS transporter [Oscillospiraceae bacterium]|nr:MFS transporter [Oscillospiraceae bacterium]